MDERPRERANLLVMGRHLGNRWGGVYEVLLGLLGAFGAAAEAQGRSIEILTPRPGLCPPTAGVREVALPRWGGSRLMWDHRTVRAYANRKRGSPGSPWVLYNPGIVLPAGLRIPAVVSIHDLLYFPRPELDGEPEYLRGEAWYMRRMIRRSLGSAAAVHVPSESTRHEAEQLFPGIAGNRIHAVPYAVDAGRWGPLPQGESRASGEAELRKRGVVPPYVLYAGGLSRRKNVGVLLEAFEAHRRRHSGVRLVLTGGAKSTLAEPGLEERLRRAEGEGAVLRLGEVAQPLLRLLYEGAWCFVYPSRYEGFGLPPLEAQAAGCPVIAARSTSLPEVLGESARLFDPHSAGELEAALQSLTEPGGRENWIERGRRNVLRFTWARTAAGLLELADGALAEGAGDGRGGAARRG